MVIVIEFTRVFICHPNILKWLEERCRDCCEKNGSLMQPNVQLTDNNTEGNGEDECVNKRPLCITTNSP